MSCTHNVDEDSALDDTPLSSLGGSSCIHTKTSTNQDLLPPDREESWMIPQVKCFCKTEPFNLQGSAAELPTHLKTLKDLNSKISSENFQGNNDFPDGGDFNKTNITSSRAVVCLKTFLKDEMCRSSSLTQRFQVEHSNVIPAAQECILNSSKPTGEQACCTDASYCKNFTASKTTKRCISECTFPTVAVMGSCIASDKRSLLSSVGPQENCGCLRVKKLALAILNATDSASDSVNKSELHEASPVKHECCCISCSKATHDSLTRISSRDLPGSEDYTECLVVSPANLRRHSSSVELSTSCTSCIKYLVPPKENFGLKSSSCEVTDSPFSSILSSATYCNQQFAYGDDSKEDFRKVYLQQINKRIGVNHQTQSACDTTDTRIEFAKASDRCEYAFDKPMHCNKSEAIEKPSDTPTPSVATEDIQDESQELHNCGKELTNVDTISKVVDDYDDDDYDDDDDDDDEFQIHPEYFAPLSEEPYDPLSSAISFVNLIEDQIPLSIATNSDMEGTQHSDNFYNDANPKSELDDNCESEDEDHIGTYYSKVETHYCESHKNGDSTESKMFHSVGESVLSVSTACTVHVEIMNEKNSTNTSHMSHSGFTYRQITRMDKTDSDLEESMTAFIQSNLHQSIPLIETSEEAERKELSDAINKIDVNSTKEILNTPCILLCDSDDTFGIQDTSNPSFQPEPEVRATQKSKSDTKQNEIPDIDSKLQPKFQRKFPNILRNRNKYFPRDDFFKPRNNFLMDRLEYSIHAQGDMLPFEVEKQLSASDISVRMWQGLTCIYRASLKLQLLLLVFLQLAQAALSYYSKDVEWELSTSGMVFRSQSVLYRMYRHYARVRPYTAIFAIHMGYSPAALVINGLTATLFLIGPVFPTAFAAALTMMMYTMSVDMFDIVITIVAVAPHLGIEFALQFVAMSVVITFTQLILWFGGYKYYHLLTRAS